MELGSWNWVLASLRISAILIVIWPALALLPGCSGDFRGPADPLLGSYAPRPGLAAAVPPGPLPPLPAPNSTASNAALASAPQRPLEADRELRISGPANGTDFTPVANPRSDLTPSPPSLPGKGVGGIGATYEQVQARLTTLGVTWQKLETGSAPGEWQFTCAIPNRQNPSISRTYQAQGRDSLAAIQAVLEQIEREPR